MHLFLGIVYGARRECILAGDDPKRYVQHFQYALKYLIFKMFKSTLVVVQFTPMGHIFHCEKVNLRRTLRRMRG